MPRESNKAKVERTAKIIGGLRTTYPDAHCELDHRNPLEYHIIFFKNYKFIIPYNTHYVGI